MCFPGLVHVYMSQKTGLSKVMGAKKMIFKTGFRKSNHLPTVSVKFSLGQSVDCVPHVSTLVARHQGGTIAKREPSEVSHL